MATITASSSLSASTNIQADTFGGSTSRWRAFQTGRTLAELEEVRWYHTLPSGRIVDAWLKENDLTQKWDFQTLSWITI